MSRDESIILANGSWTIHSIIRDLPAPYRHAYAPFFRATCLMAITADAPLTDAGLPITRSGKSASAALALPCRKPENPCP